MDNYIRLLCLALHNKDCITMDYDWWIVWDRKASKLYRFMTRSSGRRLIEEIGSL